MSLVPRYSKLLCRQLNKISVKGYASDDGVSDMGKKWKERQQAFEEEYFYRKVSSLFSIISGEPRNVKLSTL